MSSKSTRGLQGRIDAVQNNHRHDRVVNNVPRQIDVRNDTGRHDIGTWKSMDEIYNMCSHQLITYLTSVNENCQVIERTGRTDQHFNTLVKTLVNDCDGLADKLLEIKQLHKDFSGMVTQDQTPIYYDCSTRYANLAQQIITITTQYTVELTDYLVSASKDITGETLAETAARLEAENSAASQTTTTAQDNK